MHTDTAKKLEYPSSFQIMYVDFKPKLLRRDKEGHYILLKGSINQQDITT